MPRQTVPLSVDKIIKWSRNPQVRGRRTGLDVKAGKNIRIRPDGFEEFKDYFSRSESPELDADVTGSSEDKPEKSDEAGKLKAKSSHLVADISPSSKVGTSSGRYHPSTQHTTRNQTSQIDLKAQLNLFDDQEDNTCETSTPHRTCERGTSLGLLQKKPVWIPDREDSDEPHEMLSQKFHDNSPRTKTNVGTSARRYPSTQSNTQHTSRNQSSQIVLPPQLNFFDDLEDHNSEPNTPHTTCERGMSLELLQKKPVWNPDGEDSDEPHKVFSQKIHNSPRTKTKVGTSARRYPSTQQNTQHTSRNQSSQIDLKAQLNLFDDQEDNSCETSTPLKTCERGMPLGLLQKTPVWNPDREDSDEPHEMLSQKFHDNSPRTKTNVGTSAQRYPSTQSNTQRTSRNQSSQIVLPPQLNFFDDLEDHSSEISTPHKTGERGMSLEFLKKPVWNPDGKVSDELQEVSSRKFYFNSPRRSKTSLCRRLSPTKPIKNTREQKRAFRKTPDNVVNISTWTAEGSASVRSTKQMSPMWQRLFDCINNSDGTNDETFIHVDEMQEINTSTPKASKVNHITSPFLERSKSDAEPKQDDINIVKQNEMSSPGKISKSPITQRYQKAVSRLPLISSEKDDDNQETTFIRFGKNKQTSLQMSRGIAQPSCINSYLNGGDGDDIMGGSMPTNKASDHALESPGTKRAEKIQRKCVPSGDEKSFSSAGAKSRKHSPSKTSCRHQYEKETDEGNDDKCKMKKKIMKKQQTGMLPDMMNLVEDDDNSLANKAQVDSENDSFILQSWRNKSRISTAASGRRLLEVVTTEDDSFSEERGVSLVGPSKPKLLPERKTIRADLKTRARVHDDAGKEKNTNSHRKSWQSPESHSKVPDGFESIKNKTKVTARKRKNNKRQPAEIEAEGGETSGTSKQKVVPNHNKDVQNQHITEKTHEESKHEERDSNARVSNNSPEKRRGAAIKRKRKHPTDTIEQLPLNKKKHYSEVNSYTEGTGNTKKLQRNRRTGHRNQTKQRIQKTEESSSNLPVQNNENPVRRSCRQRVQTLAFWRLEHIEYKRDSNGLLSFDHIERGSSDDIFPNKPKRRKNHQPHKPSNNIELPVDTTLPPNEDNQLVSTVAAVLDPSTGQEIDTKVVQSGKSLVFLNSRGEVASKQTSFSIGKLFGGDMWVCGRLKVLPFAENPTQKAESESRVFYILSGKVYVTIHKTAFVLEANDAFLVPQGNMYSLKNLSSGTAELFYFIIDKSFSNPE